jgi:hypothetical protein
MLYVGGFAFSAVSGSSPRHFFTLLIPLVQTAGHAENLVKQNP